MKLITSELKAHLLENGRKQQTVRGTHDEIDFWPVVKLFTPDAGCTWLLTEIDPEDLVERFQRTAENYVTWTVTYDNPATYVRPYTVEIPLRHTNDAMYEYACHEGNYGLRGILAGARAEDAREAAGATSGSGSR